MRVLFFITLFFAFEAQAVKGNSCGNDETPGRSHYQSGHQQCLKIAELGPAYETSQKNCHKNYISGRRFRPQADYDYQVCLHKDELGEEYKTSSRSCQRGYTKGRQTYNRRGYDFHTCIRADLLTDRYETSEKNCKSGFTGGRIYYSRAGYNFLVCLRSESITDSYSTSSDRCKKGFIEGRYYFSKSDFGYRYCLNKKTLGDTYETSKSLNCLKGYTGHSSQSTNEGHSFKICDKKYAPTGPNINGHQPIQKKPELIVDEMIEQVKTSLNNLYEEHESDAYTSQKILRDFEWAMQAEQDQVRWLDDALYRNGIEKEGLAEAIANNGQQALRELLSELQEIEAHPKWGSEKKKRKMLKVERTLIKTVNRHLKKKRKELIDFYHKQQGR